MSNPESLTLKVVQRSDPEQFGIESNYRELDGYRRETYVSFSGYFGKFGPHVFAAAPDLLEALYEAAEYIGDRSAGSSRFWDLYDSAIAKATGQKGGDA